MADTTLILHGWGDCSESFRSLESLLVDEGIRAVETIYYADYESREDAITYEDVVGGLDNELRRRGLVDERGRGSFDVMVRSTGGMVIHHWIWRYYGHRIDDCPVENLVMLAPANFGSPRAHRGNSLLGRVFGGRWKIGDMLEVGRRLLDGLELGSAYQWELAPPRPAGTRPPPRRRPGPAHRPGGTIGLQRAPGLDAGEAGHGRGGVVNVGTSCTSAGRRLGRRPRRPGLHPSAGNSSSSMPWTTRISRCVTSPSSSSSTAVDGGRETLIGETRRGGPHGPRMLTSRERELSNAVNRRMTAHFHTYSRDPSFRRALVDVDGVEEILPDGHVLAIRMYVARVEDGIYYDTDHLRDIVIHDPAGDAGADGGSPRFLHPDTTTLVQLRVDRVTDYVTVDTRPREH